MNTVIVYGGSFEPPHKGHAHVIRTLNESFGFDQLVIVPNWKSPLKDTIKIAKHHKKELLKLFISDLIKEHPNYEKTVKLELYELEQNSTSYTINTLIYLSEKYPDVKKWCLAIGSDQLLELGKWKDINLILKRVHVIIIQRHVYNHSETIDYLKRLAPDCLSVYQLSNEINPITATTIRNQYESLNELKNWLTPSVFQYIKTNKDLSW